MTATRYREYAACRRAMRGRAGMERENARLARENAMLRAAEALREEVRVLRLANRGWARKAGER